MIVRLMGFAALGWCLGFAAFMLLLPPPLTGNTTDAIVVPTGGAGRIDRGIALLVGGHDRGVDWSDFAAHMRHDAPATLITMGANGPRIHALLAPVAQEAGFALIGVETLPEAMTAAREALGGEGVVLLSPGAPSFGQYKDYVARGRHFAELAGFDPDAITAIPGLGLA